MARKFFSDPEKSAHLLEVDGSLVRRFAKIILQTLASGEKIKVDAFDNFAKKTAEDYVTLYAWYYMPASIHKILLHGSDVIKHAILPIGKLSEEAGEARNKEFRKARKEHTRKISRQVCNEDILKYLLITSDPLISSLRPKLFKVHRKEFLPEVYELLQINKIGNENVAEENK